MCRRDLRDALRGEGRHSGRMRGKADACRGESHAPPIVLARLFVIST